MFNAISKVLLKLNYIEKATMSHQAQRKEQSYHEEWAELMRSGNTVRVDEVRNKVTPLFIDSTNWGGM